MSVCKKRHAGGTDGGFYISKMACENVVARVSLKDYICYKMWNFGSNSTTNDTVFFFFIIRLFATASTLACAKLS